MSPFLCSCSPFPLPLLLPLLLLLLLVPSPQLTAASRRVQHRRREAIPPATGPPPRQPQSAGVFRYQCPPGCFCVPDIVDIELLIVSCRWARLTSRSFDLFPKSGTKSLTIQCSEPGLDPEEDSPLRPAAFDGFSELRELKITGCQCRQLDGDVFAGASRLRSLSLSQMPFLDSLQPNFFDRLGQLEKLTLAENGIREMPRDGLCRLQSVQVLNLSHSALSSVPRPSGRPCQLAQLLILDLSGNNIAVLAEDDLLPFPALRQLTISGNRMVEIQPDTFRPETVSLLQHMDLSANRLKELPPALPQGTVSLDLSRNQFAHFPPAVTKLTTLMRLNMSGNEIGEEALGEMSLDSGVLEQLDLSWNSLGRIPASLLPAALDSLKVLRLAGNRIGRLEPAQVANFSVLQELDLSSNRLSSLPLGAFDGLPELELLQLANNSIGEVHAEAFRELGQRLHTLAMSRNVLTELPMAVGRLSRVRRMDFSRNNISRAFKFVLNKLSHLARLDLAENELDSVDSYVFADCAHLQELSLRANRIQSISPDAFEKCPRLKRLDLSANRLTKAGPALKSAVALKQLNISANAIDRLDWANFPDGLIELLANGNSIRQVDTLAEQTQTDDGGKKLRRLELRGNGLSRLSGDQLPPSLEELDLRQNALVRLANGTFHALAQLKTVDLRFNQLRSIPRELFDQTVGANAPFGQLWISENPLECGCEMGWLLNASAARESTGGVRDIGQAECTLPFSGRRTPVTKAVPSDFLCRYSQLCGFGCVCCEYRECDCKSRCPPGCHCFRDQHSVNNLVKCDSWPENKEFNPRELPMQATHILLDGLNIPELREYDLVARDRLSLLHITNSRLATIGPSALHALPNLRTLNLSGNRLSSLNGNEFNQSRALTLLDLSANRLTRVDPRLAEMAPRLGALLLHNNSLTSLPALLRNAAGERLSQITLADNPFRCDCASTGRFDTPHWLARNRQRVEDAELVHCVENVTWATAQNDTTVLSDRVPNLGDDLFRMPMLQFLDQENRTLCVPFAKGLFGIGGPFDTFLSVCLILMAFVILLLLLVLSAKWVDKQFGPNSKRRRTTKESKVKLIGNNSNSLSSTRSPVNAGGSNSPLLAFQRGMPPADPDIFLFYSKKDEHYVLLELCPLLEAAGYSICLLHYCGCYEENLCNISDGMNRLLAKCRIMVVFLTPEFLGKEWTKTQVTTSIKLHKDNADLCKIFIVSKELEERMDTLVPDELGKFMRKNGFLYLNRNPRFWEELRSRMPPPKSYSLSESGYVYSSENEYGTIPPAPSEFV